MKRKKYESEDKNQNGKKKIMKEKIRKHLKKKYCGANKIKEDNRDSIRLK